MLAADVGYDGLLRPLRKQFEEVMERAFRRLSVPIPNDENDAPLLVSAEMKTWIMQRVSVTQTHRRHSPASRRALRCRRKAGSLPIRTSKTRTLLVSKEGTFAPK